MFLRLRRCSWCGPCRSIAPLFAEMASTHGGDVTFVKIDVDDNAKTAEEVRDDEGNGSDSGGRPARRSPAHPPS